MLNSSANNTLNMSVNSVSGTIVKSHPKSYFRRAHIDSLWMKSMIENQSSIVILQMMQSHEGFLIMEVVNKNDYDLPMESE